MQRTWKIIIVIAIMIVLGIGAGVVGFLSGHREVEELPVAPSASSGALLTAPDRGEAATLVDGTMREFAAAVTEKDFTDFYGTISDLWRKQTTAAKISEAFSGFFPFTRELKESVASGPLFNAPPLVNEKNILILEGFYHIEATKMLFNLQYVNENWQWKLLGMDVEVK